MSKGAENRSGGFYAVVLVGSDWSCRYRPCLVANSSKEIAPDFPQKISPKADFLFRLILSLFSEL